MRVGSKEWREREILAITMLTQTFGMIWALSFGSSNLEGIMMDKNCEESRYSKRCAVEKR